MARTYKSYKAPGTRPPPPQYFMKCPPLITGYLDASRTKVASVGSVFNNTRKVKVFSLPETIQEKIDVSSEGPSSGVSSGGQGKTTRVFIRVNTKTSRDKIKANQMDFIKTK